MVVPLFWSFPTTNSIGSLDDKVPSGKVHDRITIVTAAVSVPAWWAVSNTHDPVPLCIVLGAYIFSGFWLSDDLDTKSVAYHRWGFLRWLWLPYRKLVPHRSWLSHGIGIGPLLRVIYFMFMFWAVARGVMWLAIKEGAHINRDIILGSLWNEGFTWTISHPTYSLWIFTGLILGGVVHSLADGITTFFKKAW